MILLKNMRRYFALSFSVLMGAVLTWVLTVVMTDTAPTWFPPIRDTVVQVHGTFGPVGLSILLGCALVWTAISARGLWRWWRRAPLWRDLRPDDSRVPPEARSRCAGL